MTLKSFAERLGSIIETLQRINISFNLSKASLDAADEFKADYIIDHLQQSVAKLLTIKVHNAEPAEETVTAEPTQTESITDNNDLNEDITSSPDKHKDSSNSETVKSESHAASSSTSDPTVTFLGQVSEGEQITVKVELQDAADEYVEEYAAGDAECMEEEADVLTGGVYLVDDDDEEEKVPTTSKRGRPPKSETEQTKSPDMEVRTQHTSMDDEPETSTTVSADQQQPSTSGGSHTTISEHICDICYKVFSRGDSLKRHGLKHNNELYRCDECGKSFYERYALRKHVETGHVETRYDCDMCVKYYKSKEGLDKHKRLHAGQYQYLCPYCAKGYQYKNTFESHIVSHTGERNYKCDKCPSDFNNSSHLSRHRKLCGVDNKIFECDRCSKGFKAPEYLKEHKRSIHDNVVYQCPACGKLFNRRSSLYLHKKKSMCD